RSSHRSNGDSSTACRQTSRAYAYSPLESSRMSLTTAVLKVAIKIDCTREVLRRRRRATRGTQRRGTSAQRVTKNREMPTTHRGQVLTVPRSLSVRPVLPHCGVG